MTPRADLGFENTVEALFHDLRQPLTAILLLAGAGGGDPAHRLEAIGAQAEWMAVLVEEVLGSRPQPSARRLDVSVVARAAVERARAAAACELDFRCDPDLYALVDEVGLGRAFGCVIDNAIRAAGPDGHVRVTAGTDDDAIAVHVLDDGPGPGRIASHTSLGLAITRAVLCSFGGTFELTTRTAGGACAEITLPAATQRGQHTMGIGAT